MNVLHKRDRSILLGVALFVAILIAMLFAFIPGVVNAADEPPPPTISQAIPLGENYTAYVLSIDLLIDITCISVVANDGSAPVTIRCFSAVQDIVPSRIVSLDESHVMASITVDLIARFDYTCLIVASTKEVYSSMDCAI